MKSWLQDNDIEMYPTHNDRKSDVAKWFSSNKIMQQKINYATRADLKNATGVNTTKFAKNMI